MTSHKVQKQPNKGYWFLNFILLIISVELAVAGNMDPDKVGKALGIILVLWFAIMIVLFVSALFMRWLMR